MTTTSNPTLHRFEDPERLADALSERLVDRLRAGIAARGTATLIVSGGRTPLPLFERLAVTDLGWSQVQIGLADERWVGPEDPGSNERFVREHLLHGHAAAAAFTGLKNEAATAARGATAAWRAIAKLSRPFDVVLLGMGDDGHTASLFPDNPNLAKALDADAAPGCVATRAPVAPQERLTLNCAALLDAREIIVSSAGEAKWQVYESALGEGPAQEMPIRAIFRQRRTPVEFFWAP
jgi:6-phosphogluconolactonase